MKIGMYMYDRDINLNDEATKDFLLQYDNARATMKQILEEFEDESTRMAIFYAMGLRTLLDDFIEFCTEDIDVKLMEQLLNNEIDIEDDIEDYDCDDEDFEIVIDYDNEED
jgi:hypothetical protein